MMTSVSVSSFSFYKKHYETFSRRKKSSRDEKSSVNSLYRVPVDSNGTNQYISPFDSLALESFRGSREKPNLPRPSLFGSAGVFGVRSEPTDDSTGVYAMFSKRGNRLNQGNQDRQRKVKARQGMIPAKLRSRLTEWKRGRGSDHLCRNIRRFDPLYKKTKAKTNRGEGAYYQFVHSQTNRQICSTLSNIKVKRLNRYPKRLNKYPKRLNKYST